MIIMDRTRRLRMKRYGKRESCKGGRAYISCICYGGERCNTGSAVNAGNMSVFA